MIVSPILMSAVDLDVCDEITDVTGIQPFLRRSIFGVNTPTSLISYRELLLINMIA